MFIFKYFWYLYDKVFVKKDIKNFLLLLLNNNNNKIKYD